MKSARTVKRLFAGATLVLSIIAMAGCDKDDEEKYTLYFSHNNHVNKYDALCTDCHGEAQGGRYVKPGHSACVDCHEDWMDKTKISEKTCGECHKSQKLDELAKLEVPEPVPGQGGTFVHTDTLSNRCTDCHGSLFGDKLWHVPEMKPSDIVRIRNEAHSWKMDCNACHNNMDPDTKPPNHDENWMVRHGAQGEQPDSVCSVCHKEQSCRECHQVMMPQSHNNLWRQKTHGIEAAWDRMRCQVCHDQDSCTACHSQMQPQSHNANWKRTHCFQCHPSESTGTGCSLCHEGGLDAHPNPHPAGWINSHCQSCHNGSPESEQCQVCHKGLTIDSHPNPHPPGFFSSHCNSCHEDSTFNGVSCTACHGGDLLDNHPNPHSAGFRNSHCNSCHPGSQAADQCAKCHEGGSSVLVHQDFWPPVHDRFGDQANCYDCHH